MKKHLINIIDSILDIPNHQDLVYEQDDIKILNEILLRFVNKIDNCGILKIEDLEDYETANDIIYNLNLNNNQAPFTDLISTEFYAFGYEFQESLKH